MIVQVNLPMQNNLCVPIITCVTQQIKVTMNDDDMDTYVFAVGTRKALVRLQKEMQDLVCIGAVGSTLKNLGVREGR